MASLLTSQQSLVAIVANFAESILATDSSSWTIGKLESQLELLRSYWNRLQANHLELVTKGRLVDDPYFSQGVFENTEAAVTEAFSRLYDEGSFIDSSQQIVVRTAQPAPHSLPRINLPSFNGSQADWESFRDLYTDLVHTNATLTDVQRLCHLKAALHGEAKRALDGVSVTAANYQTAWNLLLKRYNNNRLLVQESLSTLLSISELKVESAANLQSLLDILNRKRDSLSHLGRPVDYWDDWFSFLAARGMDPRTRSDWEHELRGEDKIPTFDEVESFLQRKVWALKATEASTRVKPSPASRSPPGHSSTSRSRTRLMATLTSKGTCRCCGDQHYLGHCAEWRKRALEQRRAMVSSLQLCFNCLRSGHLANNCRSKSRCQQCKALHHTLLHRSTKLKRTAQHACDSNRKKVRLEGEISSRERQSPPSSA